MMSFERTITYKNGYTTFLKTTNQLWEELFELKEKQSHYRHLAFSLKTLTSSSMRIRVLYKPIEIQYNIVEATVQRFSSKMYLLIEKQFKVNDDFMDYTDSQPWLARTFEKLEECYKAADEVNAALHQLKVEWDELKGELNIVVDHLTQQVQRCLHDEARRGGGE